MVPDVAVKGAHWDVLRIWHAVRLDLVRRSIDKLSGPFTSRDCVVVPSDADISVSPMAVESGFIWESPDAFRVEVDGLTVLSEVGGASAVPDQGFHIVRIGFVCGFGLLVLR